MSIVCVNMYVCESVCVHTCAGPPLGISLGQDPFPGTKRTALPNPEILQREKHYVSTWTPGVNCTCHTTVQSLLSMQEVLQLKQAHYNTQSHAQYYAHT